MKLLKRPEHSLSYSMRRRLLDQDLAEVTRFMSGRVLEIGNGHVGRRGRFRPPVKQTQGWLYVDLDGRRLPDIQADVERLPFGDAGLDTVVCLEVLEYVTHPGAALAEMRRVLKPGGSLVLATPFLHRADTAHDYWRFTEFGLRSLLDETGFRVVQFRPQGNALAVVANVLMFLVSSLPSLWARRCLGYASRPLLAALSWLDGPTRARQPLLGTFSTGYLVVARV